MKIKIKSFYMTEILLAVTVFAAIAMFPKASVMPHLELTSASSESEEARNVTLNYPDADLDFQDTTEPSDPSDNYDDIEYDIDSRHLNIDEEERKCIIEVISSLNLFRDLPEDHSSKYDRSEVKIIINPHIMEAKTKCIQKKQKDNTFFVILTLLTYLLVIATVIILVIISASCALYYQIASSSSSVRENSGLYITTYLQGSTDPIISPV